MVKRFCKKFEKTKMMRGLSILTHTSLMKILKQLKGIVSNNERIIIKEVAGDMGISLGLDETI